MVPSNVQLLHSGVTLVLKFNATNPQQDIYFLTTQAWSDLYSLDQ